MTRWDRVIEWVRSDGDFHRACTLLGVTRKHWIKACERDSELDTRLRKAMEEYKAREEMIDRERWEKFLEKVRTYGNVVRARDELGITSMCLRKHLNASVEDAEEYEQARSDWTERLGGKGAELVEMQLDAGLRGEIEVGPKLLETAYKVMARQDQDRWKESKDYNINDNRDYGISIEDAQRVLLGARQRMIEAHVEEEDVIDVESEDVLP